MMYLSMSIGLNICTLSMCRIRKVGYSLSLGYACNCFAISILVPLYEKSVRFRPHSMLGPALVSGLVVEERHPSPNARIRPNIECILES